MFSLKQSALFREVLVFTGLAGYEETADIFRGEI